MPEELLEPIVPIIEGTVTGKEALSTENVRGPDTLPVNATPDTAVESPYNDFPDFMNIPSNQAVNLIMEALSSGNRESAKLLMKRKKQVSHGSTLSIMEQNNQRQLELVDKSSNSKYTLLLNNIDLLKGNNTPAKKIFTLIMGKANEQLFFDGIMVADQVTFSLQEMVDKGMYKNRDTARRAFKTAREVLTSLRIQGNYTQKLGKKQEVRVDNLQVLFTGGTAVGGQCTVDFNPKLDWRLLIQYFMAIPQYYFSIESNRGSDLCFYICYLARQNAQLLQKNGSFKISYRALQQRLMLPDENQTKNPKKLIKEEIDAAVTAVEEAHSDFCQKTGEYGAEDLSLIQHPAPADGLDMPIKQYLDTGYLEISIGGKFAEALLSINATRTKKVTQHQKAVARAIQNNTTRGIVKKATEAAGKAAGKAAAEEVARLLHQNQHPDSE